VLGDYPNFYCEFDDRDLRIHGDQLGLTVIHNSCLHTDFKFGKVEMATKFLMLKLIEMRSHVVSKQGVKEMQS